MIRPEPVRWHELLFRPDRVADAAFMWPAAAAWPIGMAAWLVPLIVLASLLGVSMYEPFGDWTSLRGNVAEGIASGLGCMAVFVVPILGLFVIAVCHLFRWQVARLNPVDTPSIGVYLRTGALTAVPWALPAAIWAAMVGLHALNSDVMGDPSMDWLLASPLFAASEHPAWLFGWAFVGTATLVYALWRVGRFSQRRLNLCEACGYDLRGTLAADIVRCPECGLSVTQEPTSETKPAHEKTGGR